MHENSPHTEGFFPQKWSQSQTTSRRIRTWIWLVLPFVFLIGIGWILAPLFSVFFSIFSGGRVTLINETEWAFSGHIAFWQHESLVGQTPFMLSWEERRVFSAPDAFHDGRIRLILEHDGKQYEKTWVNDYLYAFNVDEVASIVAVPDGVEIQ